MAGYAHAATNLTWSISTYITTIPGGRSEAEIRLNSASVEVEVEVKVEAELGKILKKIKLLL